MNRGKLTRALETLWYCTGWLGEDQVDDKGNSLKRFLDEAGKEIHEVLQEDAEAPKYPAPLGRMTLISEEGKQ